MTRPQTITVEHLRALLDTEDAGSIIGFLGGKVEIIEAAERDNEDNRGALEVISRDELRERLGDQPDDEGLNAQATALTMAVEHLGG